MKKGLMILLAMITLINSGLWGYVQSPLPPVKEEIQKAFDLLEANIANPHWLKTEAYRAFRERMLSEEALQLEENDFMELFRAERRKLPFTHFYLDFNGEPSSAESEAVYFSWKPLSEVTAYLDINNFAADAASMLRMVQEIGAGNYRHLIIDLRGNTGGTLDAAVVLGQFLTSAPIDAGLYLTRRWYEQRETPPAPAEFGTFPYLQDMTYEGFSIMLRKEQGFRMVLPGHDRPTFKGKVYVLTDGITGSACEPLVDLLKKEGIATVVGGQTAGAMLSGATFEISDNLSVFLPVADYLTANGERIDKVGVAPHHEVKPAEALKFVLEELIGRE